MNKTIYTLLFLMGFVTLMVAQVPKKILVEETTQASCPPCFSLNPAFDRMVEANEDKVVCMKYQVWWPGYDPMYEENAEDVNVRVGDYLGANAAPNMYVNGGSPEAVTGLTQSRIDQLYNGQTSPIRIDINHNLNDATGAVDISVTITNESANDFPANTYRLITVLQEDDITYATPPGTNGELEFKWVMRKMLPDANGTMLTEAIPAGGSKTFDFSYPIPWYTKDLGFIAATAWVENPNSRAVVQAEHSAHKPLNGIYPDLATSYQLNGYDGYCDTEADVVFSVRNEGTADVMSFDINAVQADGSLALIETWTGSLAPGAEETVTLSGLPLAPGANSLRAVVTNIDGRPDRNGHNGLVDNTVYYVLSDTPVGTDINEGFNISQIGEVPANMILDNPAGLRLFTVNQLISTTVTWPLGGHGNSDGCMRYDFPTWAPGGAAATVFDKIDLTDSENTTLEWTHGYAARGGANGDRIVVQISVDCAQNWETVYDVTGAQIITGADPGSSNRFYPRPNEWQDVKLDIPQVDGANEVIVRFIGVSAGAQAYYLDDVILKSNPTVSTLDENLKASFKAYPNPATDFVNVEFELTESTNVKAMVYDVTGKVVDVLAAGNVMASGTQTLTWRPTVTGVYTVQIETDNGRASERITVVK